MNPDTPQPHSVIWFPNGQAAVCDRHGQQISDYQGNHQQTLRTFQQAGIDWTKLPDVLGSPQKTQPPLPEGGAASFSQDLTRFLTNGK